MFRRSCSQGTEKTGLHTKKKTVGYKERSETAREEYQQTIASVPMPRRIYVDECGISQCFSREYGYALRGKRIYSMIPGKKFARLNVIAGYCDGQILGEYCYQGVTTAKRFEDWFCDFLLPLTQPGDVVIMDNASFHNKKRLREYAQIYKVILIFLPPYSPDYNLLEHVWANLKRFLRNTTRQFHSLQSSVYWFLVFGYS